MVLHGTVVTQFADTALDALAVGITKSTGGWICQQ
jgi:hypothetical protein